MRGLSLQKDALKGFYMGRHVGGCFFFFFIALSNKKKILLVRHGLCC